MGNYNSLPKWAQKEINDLRASQNVTKNGAMVSGFHVENVGVKHTDATCEAVQSMCEAAIANAEAIKAIAKSFNGGVETINFDGVGVSFENVRTDS